MIKKEQSGQGHRWPKEVLETVAKNYQQHGAEKTAAMANITKDQAYGIAYRLKLTKQRGPQRTPAENRRSYPAIPTTRGCALGDIWRGTPRPTEMPTHTTR